MHAVVLLLMLATAAPGLAGDLTLSGSQRTRLEWIDGQVRPGFARNDAILALRTSLRLDYRDGPLTLNAELRDSRVHGSGPQSAASANDVNALEPVVLQARLEAGALLGAGTSLELTAGRMMAGLGTMRLIDSPDFRNATNGFTGLKAELEAPGLTIEALWALPQQRRPDAPDAVRANRPALDREGFDRQVWGVDFLAKRALGPLDAGFIYVGYGEADRPGRPTRNRQLHTLGPRLAAAAAPGRLDLDAEAYVQLGTIRSSLAAEAPRERVEAGFARVEIGYSFEAPWQPRLSVRYDWASGDRPGGAFTRFDRLFGNRVADFGVSGQYAAIGRANISSPGLRLGVQRGPTDGYVTARLLWADSATDSFSTTGVRDPGGRAGRFAGAQVEGRLRHWLIRDRLRLDTAFALLFREGLLVDAPNAPPGRTLVYLAPAVVASF
jgi:hypothetical protein